MKRGLWVSLAIPLMISGCLQLPAEREAPLGFELSEDWHTQPLAEGTVSEQWWLEFEDPQLNELVERTLSRSPTLRAALARVEAARASARIAGASDLPSLSLDAGGARQRSQFFLPGTGLQTFRRTQHTLGLNLSWELDLWGRLSAGEEAAIADAQAREATLHGIRQSLIGSVVRSYFRVVDLEHQVVIASRQRASAQELVDRVESRFQAGLRGALDVKRTRAELHRTQARLLERSVRLEQSRRQLELLVGDYASGTTRTAARIESRALPVPAGLPSTLVQRRPDLVDAERRVRAADLRLHEAKAGLLPSFALTASGGTSAEQLNDLLDRDFSIWALAGNLSAPLFQGGRLEAEVDRSEALVEESLANYVEVALNAFAEVETSLVAEPLLAEQEQVLATAAETSRESLELSEERYFGGLLDIINVLDTQRQTFEAESALSSIRLARIENRLNLILALGGGFERPTGWREETE